MPQTSATPRRDALTEAPSLPKGSNVYPLNVRAAAMYDDPVLHPNATGLELLREMAISQRRLEDGLTAAREELAEVRGAEIPAHLRDQGATLMRHHDRIAALEAHRDGQTEARKPWIFVLGASVTAAISALMGWLAGGWAAPHG